MADLITNRRHPRQHRKVPYWTTNKSSTPICDLDDRYLIQIGLYLYRHADEKLLGEIGRAYEFAAFLHGEQAEYAAANIINELEDKDSIDYVEEILAPEIFKELQKRKINIWNIYQPTGVKIIFND